MDARGAIAPTNFWFTRKYPLHGYILGVLTHTTASDRLWGSDETLTMWFSNWVYAPRLCFGRSSLTWHLELWPCGFKIEYTHLGFASAAAVPLGSEGEPGCIFFTLNTYQATFIIDILWYACRNWKKNFGRTEDDGGRTEDVRTDGRGSWNSYLDLVSLAWLWHKTK